MILLTAKPLISMVGFLCDNFSDLYGQLVRIMEINLSGKTAFVTGGNIGIGRAVSLSLARCGADFAFTYFSHQKEGEATIEAIKEIGQKTFVFRLDATNGQNVNEVVGQAAQALGGHIDILMNNAGHLVGRSPIVDMTDEHWLCRKA